ncbi:MAG: hypothetical protein AAFN92_09735, partial [Bacteroidota bacterium]
LLRTPAEAADESEACQDALDLLAAARTAENFRETEVAGRHGFEVTDAAGRVVGRHPKTYGTTGTRNKYLREARKHFGSRQLDGRFTQLPTAHFWCTGDLRATAVFTDRTAATANWEAYRHLLEEPTAYRIVERAKNWWVELRRSDGLVVAEAGPYPDRSAAYAAREDFPATAVLVEKPGAWTFDLYLEEALVLTGQRRYPDEATARCAFLAFGKLAADPDNYRERTDPDGCLLSFVVVDGEGVVAEHPAYLPEKQAGALRERTARHVAENYVDCYFAHQDFRWHYRLDGEDCGGTCYPLLESLGEGYETEEAARKAAAKLLTRLGEPDPFTDWTRGERYSFAVASGTSLLAGHPLTYATEMGRDQAQAEALDYVAYVQSLPERELGGWRSEPVHYVHCRSASSCGEELGEGADAGASDVLSSVRLVTDEAPLAEHPHAFATGDARENFADRLYRAALDGTLATAETTPIEEVPGLGWRFRLLDPEGIREWLRSVACYPDPDAARRAYRLLLELLTFRPNLRASDNVSAGNFGLVVAEVLLEGQVCYADPVTEVANSGNCPVICPAEYAEPDYVTTDHRFPVRNACPEQADLTAFCPRAWEEGLDTFLLQGTHEAAYYDFLDVRQDCRHGFRVVREGYRLARSPLETHTPGERERLLAYLYAAGNCDNKKNGDEYTVCVACIAGEYYPTLRAPDGTQHWRVTTKLTYENTDPDHLLAHARDVWAARQIELLNLAQEPDFYVTRREEGAFHLLLTNAAGEVVMESADVYPAAEIVAEAKARIARARRFPLYEFRGKYGFQ